MADHPLRPATDRCLGRPLPHQPANRTRAHPRPINLCPLHLRSRGSSGISRSFPRLSRSPGQVPTRYSPVRHLSATPKGDTPFDLHVLGAPPAFVLSQDQTLSFILVASAHHAALATAVPSRTPPPSPACPRSRAPTASRAGRRRRPRSPKESRPPPTPPQRLTGPQRLRPRPPGARPKGRAPHQRRPTPRTRHSKDAWTNDPSRRPRIPSLSLRFQRTTAAPRAKLSSTTPTLGAPSLRSQISPRRSGERRAESPM